MPHHPIHRRAHLLIALAGVLAIVLGAAASTEIYYSFSDGRDGGVAMLTVDGVDAPATHRRLVTIPPLARPRKLAVADDGSHLLLVDETSSAGNLVLLTLDREPIDVTRLDFPTVPDEVRAVDGGFVIGGDSGSLVFVDSNRREITARWSSRRALDPSGHKPEDIAVVPTRGRDGARIIVSFQKDSSSGRHLGSRLVTLDLPSLNVVADLQLPRDRPELHIGGNTKEQGPNPEVIVVSPTTNTLLLTLDLYGALLMADLDAVMQGRLANATVVNADPQDRWGVAFPDRVVHVRDGRDEHVVVANAGEGGGVVVADLRRRRRVAAAETIPGLDTLVHLPTIGVVVAAPAGKVKRRVGVEVEKFSEAGRDLHIIDLRGLDEGELPVKKHALGDLGTHLAGVEPERNGQVVAVLGRGETRRFALLEIERASDGELTVTEHWTVRAEGDVARLTARRPMR